MWQKEKGTKGITIPLHVLIAARSLLMIGEMEGQGRVRMAMNNNENTKRYLILGKCMSQRIFLSGCGEGEGGSGNGEGEGGPGGGKGEGGTGNGGGG